MKIFMILYIIRNVTDPRIQRRRKFCHATENRREPVGRRREITSPIEKLRTVYINRTYWLQTVYHT